MFLENIGLKLSLVAKNQGLSQAEISEITEINKTSLSHFFSGKAQLQSDNFLKLLDVLNINLSKTIDTKVDETLKKDSSVSPGQLFDELLLTIPQKYKRRNAMKYISGLAKQYEDHPKIKYISNALHKVVI